MARHFSLAFMRLVLRTVLGTKNKRMCEVDLPQRVCNTEWAGYVKVMVDSPRGGWFSLAGTQEGF